MPKLRKTIKTSVFAFIKLDQPLVHAKQMSKPFVGTDELPKFSLRLLKRSMLEDLYFL